MTGSAGIVVFGGSEAASEPCRFRSSRFAIFSCCFSLRCCSFWRFFSDWGPRPGMQFLSWRALIFSRSYRLTSGSLPSRSAPSAGPVPISAAKPSPAASTAGFRASFVHVQRAAIQFGSVQLRDGCLGLLRAGHLDERKSAWLARVPVRDDADFLYIAELCKRSEQVFLRGLVTEISYKNVSHGVLVLGSNVSLGFEFGLANVRMLISEGRTAV
jgi:hypothetical protein